MFLLNIVAITILYTVISLREKIKIEQTTCCFHEKLMYRKRDILLYKKCFTLVQNMCVVNI